MLNTIGEYKR